MELFVVTECIVQNQYTEPKYYLEAIDATYIIGIYSTRERAEQEIKNLEKYRDRSGDTEIIDSRYYNVSTYNLDETPDW